MRAPFSFQTMMAAPHGALSLRSNTAMLST